MKQGKSVRNMSASELLDHLKTCIHNGHQTATLLRNRYFKYLRLKGAESLTQFLPTLLEMKGMVPHTFWGDEHEALFEVICELIRRIVVKLTGSTFNESLAYNSHRHKESIEGWIVLCRKYSAKVAA